MGLNSFEKQANRIDFIEYMSKHYNNKDDSDEEDENQNVYYIDNENIMGINSPNTGQNTGGTYVT